MPVQMAGRIGLRDTDREFVEEASSVELRKAAALLGTVEES